jgi:hypothetical protein
MSIVIGGKVEGLPEAIARTESSKLAVRQALKAEISVLTTMVYGRVKEDYLSGRALKPETGRARASVRKGVSVTAYGIHGAVWSPVGGKQKDLPYYLKFWEYGFVRKTTKERGEAYIGRGGRLRRRGVEIRKEAARPSFHPALADYSKLIEQRIAPLVKEAI